MSTDDRYHQLVEEVRALRADLERATARLDRLEGKGGAKPALTGAAPLPCYLCGKPTVSTEKPPLCTACAR